MYAYIALHKGHPQAIQSRSRQKVSAMYKVLIPVDGSAGSERAVRHVVELSKWIGALHVDLINVQTTVDAWEVKRFLSEEEIESVQRALSEEATASVCALLDAAGIAYETHHAVGEVAQTIAEFVENHGYNQIVMGSRGMGSLQGLLLGSTSTKVLHLAHVPVTLVK